MPTFKLSRRDFEAVKAALPTIGLLAVANSVDYVYSVTCDPGIHVAGASPFGTTAIYGMPVWFLVYAPFGIAVLVLEAMVPPFARFLARYRLGIFIGCILWALLLPVLPFPHRVLGACRS